MSRLTFTHDYTDARYWAIGGIGYGRGFTAQEALDNYVSVQLRNWKGHTRITEDRLRDGELKPKVYLAPEGVQGFVIDHEGMKWEFGNDEYSPVYIEDEVTA